MEKLLNTDVLVVHPANVDVKDGFQDGLQDTVFFQVLELDKLFFRTSIIK